MAEAKVVVVTGANRGIGRAICEKILTQSNAPVHLHACSRQGANLNFKAEPPNEVHYPKLDVTSSESISSLAQGIPKVDILINNAGITDLETCHTAADVVATNYTGTRDMCTTFLPKLARGGRIVNMSSVASTQFLSASTTGIQARLRQPDLSLQDLDGIAQSFLKTYEEGEEALEKGGFHGVSNAYPFSKACVNTLTAILARENRGITVNCCCPGWVNTDLGAIMGAAPKTPEQGARIPLRLAMGDLQGVSGKYWANKSVSSDGDGGPIEW